MKLKIRGEKYDVHGQFYIIPTIKVTHDKLLYGIHHRFSLGKMGISLTFDNFFILSYIY